MGRAAKAKGKRFSFQDASQLEIAKETILRNTKDGELRKPIPARVTKEAPCPSCNNKVKEKQLMWPLTSYLSVHSKCVTNALEEAKASMQAQQTSAAKPSAASEATASASKPRRLSAVPDNMATVPSAAEIANAAAQSAPVALRPAPAAAEETTAVLRARSEIVDMIGEKESEIVVKEVSDMKLSRVIGEYDGRIKTLEQAFNTVVELFKIALQNRPIDKA